MTSGHPTNDTALTDVTEINGSRSNICRGDVCQGTLRSNTHETESNMRVVQYCMQLTQTSIRPPRLAKDWAIRVTASSYPKVASKWRLRRGLCVSVHGRGVISSALPV